jgi:S-adenosylmethionine synthetase
VRKPRELRGDSHAKYSAKRFAAPLDAVSHVGKIYALLSHQIAPHIYTLVDPVEEVYVWLCSQIGAPVEESWVAAVPVRLARPVPNRADGLNRRQHVRYPLLPGKQGLARRPRRN